MAAMLHDLKWLRSLIDISVFPFFSHRVFDCIALTV